MPSGKPPPAGSAKTRPPVVGVAAATACCAAVGEAAGAGGVWAAAGVSVEPAVTQRRRRTKKRWRVAGEIICGPSLIERWTAARARRSHRQSTHAPCQGIGEAYVFPDRSPSDPTERHDDAGGGRGQSR